MTCFRRSAVVCVLTSGYTTKMLYGKAISELPATATATAVAKGVAKDVLYLNAR